MPAKIIAIINQKGGTGKTSTAINLSAGLAAKGKRTLLLDLDPQAHSTLGLGVDPTKVKLTIHSVFSQPNAALKEAIQHTDITRLDLVPSHIKLAAAVEQLYGRLFRERILSDALSHIHALYDFVLIDCPPSLGVLTANALYASNILVVPCQMSRYSLEGLGDLLQTIEEVWRKGRSGEKIKGAPWWILLTMYETRNKVTNEVVERHLAPYKAHILKTRIAKTEAINQAHLAGRPIFLFDKRSRGAEDYRKLTDEVLALYG